MSNPSRRDFMRLSTTGLLGVAGLLGLGGLLRFLDFEAEPTAKSEIDLGPAARFVGVARTMLPEVPAVLFSTPSGFRAISLACTHLGCTVEETAQGFECPCHGSRYDQQGKALRGPARQALHELRVEVTSDGHLVLHLSSG